MAKTLNPSLRSMGPKLHPVKVTLKKPDLSGNHDRTMAGGKFPKGDKRT